VLKAWKTAGGHRRVALDSVEALVKQKQEALGEPPSESTLKILIVEQDPELRGLYQRTIREWELATEVITAGNGVEGLILLGSFRPDVLICDMFAPGIDGLETVRILRDNPEHDAMSIVIVSSLDADEIAGRGGLPVNVDHFDRPISLDLVEALVRRKLETPSPPARKVAGRSRA
jgi:CheY-like chemotaxis protein